MKFLALLVGLNSNATTLEKFYDKQIMEEGSFSISILNTLEADGAPDLKISRNLWDVKSVQ